MCKKGRKGEQQKHASVSEERGRVMGAGRAGEGGGCERVSNREGYEHGNTRRT